MVVHQPSRYRSGPLPLVFSVAPQLLVLSGIAVECREGGNGLFVALGAALASGCVALMPVVVADLDAVGDVPEGFPGWLVGSTPGYIRRHCAGTRIPWKLVAGLAWSLWAILAGLFVDLLALIVFQGGRDN